MSGKGRRSMIVEKIIEAIPFDDWISSIDISRRTGIRSQSVGIIISHNLFDLNVERKKEGESKIFVYRRLKKL